MKKTSLAMSILLMLMLSACASQVSVTNNSPAQAVEQASAPQAASPVDTAAATSVPAVPTATTAATVELNTTYDNAVSVEMQLLFGTFQLASTEQAVTKEQAAALIPLWTQIQTLSQSMGPGQGAPGQQGQADTTSQAQAPNSETQSQVDELVKQIQAAMTPAQIQAIAEMKITQETAQTVMQSAGISMGGRQGDGNGNAPQVPQGTPSAGGPGGDGQQPPSGGQQPGNGQNPSADGGMMVPPQVIDALLQLLQKI